ncbi:MAG TPA: SDR family oxidoreductase [Thermoanaerobaculia bacterium]|nr:SDR family oxidoreductase [Thermoanaerobaculia bacterium]
MNPKGRHAVVTGASSGIGRAVAIELARRGARLTLGARREDELSATAAACRDAGSACTAVLTDVSLRDHCRRLIDRGVSENGPVDILVNNAGFAIFDEVAEARTDEVEAMMRTNFFGAFWCIEAVLPSMLERGEGAIVNVGSITGLMGYARMGGYCATKFAITGLTESLRAEVIDRGVRVSLVCPGTTETAFFVTAERGKMPAASRLLLAIPPERVARAVVRAVETGRRRTILPLLAAAYMRFKEILPGPAHFLMRKVSRWIERSPR